MKLDKRSGFTLIELLIAITIFVLISMIAFAPYGFYIKKAKVRFATKELTQIIYEAKNMALHGSVSSSGNLSIGIYFDTIDSKNAYSVLSFEHDITELNINPSNGILIQKYILQPGIQIDNFDGKKIGLVFFRSITGSGIIRKGDTISNITTVPFSESENEIQIEYSFKGASNNSLNASLKYFQDTQIVDY